MTDAEGGAPRLPPAYRLVAFECVESTNDEARRAAEAGAEDGTLIWAREQTKGRGRYGRSFESPRGNLAFSLVLRPDCDLAAAAQLGFVSALAVRDAIGSTAPPLVEATFKWPNDVLFNRRKGAGILLESRSSPQGALEWLVLGVGINVVHFPKETDFPATSLRFEGCPPEVDDVALLEAFARHFMTWTDTWLEQGFPPVRRAWLAHAQGLGEAITVRLPAETFTGDFADLDETGALLVDLPAGGRRSVAAGDVYFEA